MAAIAIDLDYIAAYVVSAGDGDRCGLSELLSAIGSRRPEVDAAQVFDACVAACLTLAQREHVRLEMTPAFASRHGRDGYEVVGNGDVESTLRDAESWQSPSEARPIYWLVATDAGKSEYISEEVVSL